MKLPLPMHRDRAILAEIEPDPEHRLPVYTDMAALEVDLYRERPTRLPPNVVFDVASARCNWSHVQHHGTRWQRARAKEQIAGAMRTWSGASYPEIAPLCGTASHSAIEHAFHRFEAWPPSAKAQWQLDVIHRIGGRSRTRQDSARAHVPKSEVAAERAATEWNSPSGAP